MLERIARQLGRPTGRSGRLLARMLNRGNRSTNARAVERLGIRPGDRTLDVGFGGGVGLEALLDSPAASVAGVDPSGDMVAVARQRFGDRVTVQSGTAESLPFGDDAFDRIVSVHTVYFWDEPAAAVRELRRVLAPEGRLVLALQDRAAMEGRRIHRTGFALYDAEAIEGLLRTGGFADVRVDRAGSMLFASAG